MENVIHIKFYTTSYVSSQFQLGTSPPVNPRGLAQKTCPGVGIWLLKVAWRPGIRQGPDICGKWKWNFEKIAWIRFLQVKKKQADFWPFSRFRCFLNRIFPGLWANIWRFHWVMVIHTYFSTKGYNYAKSFVRVLVLSVINTGCPKKLLKWGGGGDTALLISK